MPTMYWSYEVFKDRLPENLQPPMPKITSLGWPGALDDLLSQSGFSDYWIENHTIHYEFDSFGAYWDAVEASDLLKMQYDALPESERSKIRDEVGRFAKDFIRDGQLIIPHEYLLAVGNK